MHIPTRSRRRCSPSPASHDVCTPPDADLTVTDFVHYLVLVAVALVATLIATPIVRDLSVRASIVDRPGGRKVHLKAVPRLGGIGIFVGFAAALAVQVAGGFAGWWPAVISRL